MQPFAVAEDRYDGIDAVDASLERDTLIDIKDTADDIDDEP